MNPGEPAVLCLEPRIDGPRHSGGFFYNDCLATAAVALAGSRSQPQVPGKLRFSIQAWNGGCLPPGTVLLDSLWWYIHKQPLDVLAAALAGRSWGIIMHGLPEQASGLLGDMAEASFVVVPSFWAAGQLEAVRSQLAASGDLDVRVLYPGWDGRPGLVPDPGTIEAKTRDSPQVRIASSSNWVRAKGLVDAALALGRISRNSACPPWLWQAAGTPDPILMAEALSGLGKLASRLQPLGHLDTAALVRLLHGSDIFMHPSGQETFCLSVFEAALAGCRVVARAIGGVPEAIHLAMLLRQQLGLPPTGVHLAAAGEPSKLPGCGPASMGVIPARTGVIPAHSDMIPAEQTDLLGMALEAALAAVMDPSSSVDENPAWDYSGHISYKENAMRAVHAGSRRLKSFGKSPDPSLREGLLHGFSWEGRLEKLLSGQSDRPLPSIIQPQEVEAP